MQSLDAGITACVKNGYRRRIFDNSEAGRKSIYNVDILTVMRLATEEWIACPSDVIENCFVQCFKQSGRAVESTGKVKEEVLIFMVWDSTEHGVVFTRVG